MINDFKIEFLKTKRTVIRKLVWIFPILAAIITTLFFASTGYVAQSLINQWSFLYANLFTALLIGLIDRHEKNSTDYKMIFSSPTNLFNYELGRILNGIFLILLGSLILIIITIMESLFWPTKISILSIIIAILGIFLTAIWQIPLYFWLSRKTNLYISILVAFLGSFISLMINETSFGNFWPYSWSSLFPVSLIKMHVNGLLVNNHETISNNSWTILASIILFVILSYLTAFSFKKQVNKND